MEYVVHYEVAGAILSFIIGAHFFGNMRLKNAQNAVFGILIVFIFMSSFFDVVSAELIVRSSIVPVTINQSMSQVYYFFQLSLPPLLFLFVLGFTRKLIPQNRKIIILLLSPFILLFIMWFLNPINGYIFYFDTSLVYHRGHYLIFAYIISAYFLLITVITVLVLRKEIGLLNVGYLFMFIAFVVLSIVINYVFPRYLLTGFASSLALLIAYINLRNPVEAKDDLTETFNRKTLQYVLEENSLITGTKYFAIASVDNFDAMGNIMGTKGTNEFLTGFVSYLKKHSEGRQVFRYTANMFVILFNNRKSMMECVGEMKDEPFIGKDRRISDLIKISLFYSDNISLSEKEDTLSLIVDGMVASHKENTQRRIVPIGPKDMKSLYERHNIEVALKRSLESEGLKVYLQPMYCFENDMYLVCEALVRIEDEEIGSLRLSEMIPIAEKNGMIVEIGRKVLERVCRIIKEENMEETGLKRIMVNLSMLEAIQPDLPSFVKDCLKSYDIPADLIGFEITETYCSLGGERLRMNMEELSALGHKFALDDFGTGYANLDAVLMLPFSIAKLDSSMVSERKRNDRMAVVLEEHVNMFKRMGLKIVAEGIETEEDFKAVKFMSVDLMQGYYFSKPMLAKKAFAFIKEYNKGKDSSNVSC